MSFDVMKINTLRELAASHAVTDTSIVAGHKGGWWVQVCYGQVQRYLGSDGEPRVFAKLDTAAQLLLRLGLSQFSVDGAAYRELDSGRSRPDRSAAMKGAADYGRWLQAEASATAARIAEGAAVYSAEQADARGAAKRAALLKRKGRSE